ncbi:MAG: division plane positioning ATPase MipZ, partial [Pseudomonadota bacterium]
QLGFRIADGISERVIFREFFPMGMTAFDNPSSAIATGESFTRTTEGKMQSSHLSARQEVRKLIGSLRLPIDDVGRRRAQARAGWIEKQNTPVAMPDIFAD